MQPSPLKNLTSSHPGKFRCERATVIQLLIKQRQFLLSTIQGRKNFEYLIMYDFQIFSLEKGRISLWLYDIMLIHVFEMLVLSLFSNIFVT